MIDMVETIAPKSDQMNADDLLAGAKTIKVSKVSKVSGEQPIAINYEGDNGKPYKPCKSMRRVMVELWGRDASEYVGRSMTLYCDKSVTWGGSEVGGIRISEMSHITEPKKLVLTATKATRKPFLVKPLLVKDAGKYIIKTSKSQANYETPEQWAAQAKKIIDKLTLPDHFKSFSELNMDALMLVKVDASEIAEDVFAYLTQKQTEKEAEKQS